MALLVISRILVFNGSNFAARGHMAMSHDLFVGPVGGGDSVLLTSNA